MFWYPPAGRLRLRLGAVAVLAVVLVSCSNVSPRPMTLAFTGRGPRVAVVGDSITWLASGRINAALSAAGFSQSVTGIASKTSRDMAPYVKAAAVAKPAVIVVELGTNDDAEWFAGQRDNALSDFEKRMSAFRAEARSSCLVVTTFTSHRVSVLGRDFTRFNDYARSANSWLKATFSHVIDWDTYEWNHRQAGVRLVDETSVHPNTAGQQALADLVLAAAKDCLAR